MTRLIPSRSAALAGFTLLEVLIASALSIMIAFFIVSLAKDVTDSSLRVSGSIFSQQQIQQTLQIMIPEIRSATQSNTGNYPIQTAATSTFEFYSDIDGDGLFEKVRYFLNGSSFAKGVVKPTGMPLQYVTSSETIATLVDNLVISNQIFSYYDVTATSTRSQPLPFPVDVIKIKTVKISLVANQGTTNMPSIIGAENEATIRNLRYK